MVIERYRKAKSAVLIGIFGNLILGLFKLIAGIMGNSLAVIADSIDTISDVLISIVVWVGLKIGIKPRDRYHPFGHGDVEPVAGLIVAIVLVIIGFEFARFTIDKIITGTFYTPGTIAIIAILVSIGVKYWLFGFTVKIGKNINSTALVTSAYNYKLDFYMSLVILIGVITAMFGFPVLDPLIGFLVALWIIKTGFSEGKKNILSIMGTVPSADILKEIRDATKKVKGVKDIHDLRVHYIGVYAFANLHIKVDPNITISQAHKIASEVEKNIKRKVKSITTVLVHTEP